MLNDLEFSNGGSGGGVYDRSRFDGRSKVYDVLSAAGQSMFRLFFSQQITALLNDIARRK